MLPETVPESSYLPYLKKFVHRSKIAFINRSICLSAIFSFDFKFVALWKQTSKKTRSTTAIGYIDLDLILLLFYYASKRILITFEFLKKICFCLPILSEKYESWSMDKDRADAKISWNLINMQACLFDTLE